MTAPMPWAADADLPWAIVVQHIGDYLVFGRRRELHALERPGVFHVKLADCGTNLSSAEAVVRQWTAEQQEVSR